MKLIWQFLVSLPFMALIAVSPAPLLRAQVLPDSITPDQTLAPGERSTVTPPAVDRLIEGGAPRGNNLFHSFQNFNVLNGQRIYFDNPTGIQNILTRITGNTRSDILGTLGVLGPANLFLINPNGILFGPNARLDLQGSFVGSTANSMIFENGFEFSTTNPQAPPLLTVNFPVGLRLRDNPNEIRVQGFGLVNSLNGTGENFTDPNLGVLPGQALALFGGNVAIEGGILQAPGGTVSLGGLSQAGVIQFTENGVVFPENVAKANITLTDSAGINIISSNTAGGGLVLFNARNIGIFGESLITAGLTFNLGTLARSTPLSNIVLNATGETRIDQSRIENIVHSGTFASSGNIRVNTDSFAAVNGSSLDTSNLEAINDYEAGDVRIDAARSLFIDKTDVFSKGFYGRIFLTSANNAIDVRNSILSTTTETTSLDPERITLIQLQAPNGSIFLDQTILSTSNLSTGFAGDIVLGARDQISITDVQPTTEFPTIANRGLEGRIFIGKSNSYPDTLSPNTLRLNNALLDITNAPRNPQAPDDVPLNAGSIFINAGDIFLTNFSQISSSTRRLGNAGNVFVTATGTVSLGDQSAISSEVQAGATGNAGIVTLNARSLELTERSTITSAIFGGARDNPSRAGNVSIKVNDDIRLSDVSTIRSAVESGGVGFGGNIDITGRSLTLLSGGAVVTSVFSESDDGTLPAGIGRAGSITINTTDAVTISGVQGTRSGLFTSAEVGSEFLDDPNAAIPGFSGGDITLTTSNLALSDFGIINGRTQNQGKGGNVTVNAQTFSLLSGGKLLLEATGQGDAGSATLNIANRLTISGENSGIFVDASGTQAAFGGNISIRALNNQLPEISLDDGAVILVNSRSEGLAGNVSIRGNRLTLDNQSSIVASSQLSLDFLDYLRDFFPEVVTILQSNTNFGNIDIDVAKDIRLNQGSRIEANTNIAPGNVALRSQVLVLRNGSNITTNASDFATGGNITLNTDILAGLRNSNITANATEGDAGRVTINSQARFGIQARSRVQLLEQFGTTDPEQTPTSDITAFSNVSLSENVTLNNPDVDPSQGLIELPQTVVDPSRQIAQTPCRQGTNSQFVITRRGGVPTSPGQPSDAGAVRVGLVDPVTNSATTQPTTVPTIAPTATQIVPAQGWRVNEKGEIVLTAQAADGNGTPRSIPTSATCTAP